MFNMLDGAVDAALGCNINRSTAKQPITHNKDGYKILRCSLITSCTASPWMQLQNILVPWGKTACRFKALTPTPDVLKRETCWWNTEVCFGVVFIKILSFIKKIRLLTEERHTFALCSTRPILIQILIQVLILTSQTRSNGFRYILLNLFSACFMVNKCTDTKYE